MTVPPEPGSSGDERPAPAAENDPAFDPYRYGAPDHPIPPEFAPPGYKGFTPQPSATPPAPPPYAAPSGYQPPARQPSYQASPPPPGYGPYGYDPYGQPAVAPRRSTGKATAALVLGIASIPLALASFLDIVPIALAIIFGVLHLTEAKRSQHREGRGPAVAGLWCAAVGAVLAVVLTVFYVHIGNQCKQYEQGTSSYSNCVRDQI